MIILYLFTHIGQLLLADLLALLFKVEWFILVYVRTYVLVHLKTVFSQEFIGHYWLLPSDC